MNVFTDLNKMCSLEDLSKESPFVTLCNDLIKNYRSDFFKLYDQFEPYKERLSSSNQERLDEWLNFGFSFSPDWLKTSVQTLNPKDFTVQTAKGLPTLASLMPSKVCPDCHQACEMGTKCQVSYGYHMP